MLVKTILNRIEKHPGFIYGRIRLEERGGDLTLTVDVRPRAGTKAKCSGCGAACPGYDTLPTRSFQFVPLWGILVFFLYAMRRVDCPRCGIVVECVPWGDGKKQITQSYAWFLAIWARRLSWKETAEVFKTSWDTVYRAVEFAVLWGLEHRDLAGITAIGVDEVQWQVGHQYLTLVYQIDTHRRRLLWIGKKRTIKTLLQFFRWFSPERAAELKFVCSDMWRPYMKVIAKKARQAVHVLDRFHIMSHFSKALDEVRADEARKMKAHGFEPILSHSRWCILKRPENLTANQQVKLADLLQYNLKTVRAYLLKEDFQLFWHYVSPAWAAKFLDTWCSRAMRSKIEPMKKIARMLRSHRHLILNWFVAKGAVSSGTVEGFNNKVKLTTRKAFGYKSFKLIQISLFHVLGDLPVPQRTHRFC
jgi:transposase